MTDSDQNDPLALAESVEIAYGRSELDHLLLDSIKAFQIPRQRKLKAAEATKAKLAAEARNGRLGRGGGARELSGREAWRLGLVLQYIVDNALLGLAVSLMGANEGKCALATIGHGWLLVGMKI